MRTHRVSKSLHWPSHSGSAFTFVTAMDLPRTARACGPRPPRNNGQTWGRTGRSHRKSPRIASTHTRMHVIDTPMHSERRLYPEADVNPTRARNAGAPARAPATNARTHARLDAAPKYMCLSIDGCSYIHIYIYIYQMCTSTSVYLHAHTHSLMTIGIHIQRSRA